MKKQFSGRIYVFKNGETKKENGNSVDVYNLSDYPDTIRVELYEDGVKIDAIYDPNASKK